MNEIMWLCNECGELFEAPETCGYCPVCDSIDIQECEDD